MFRTRRKGKKTLLRARKLITMNVDAITMCNAIICPQQSYNFVKKLKKHHDAISVENDGVHEFLGFVGFHRHHI